MAASSPKMMTDIFLTNQEPVLRAISRCVKKLEKLEKLIRAGNEEQLEDYFEKSLLRHRRLVLPQEDR
jgi:prephenate dehydrogenase